MKRLLFILVILFAMILQSCKGKAQQQQNLSGKKILIAYFSRRGNNYVNGNIVNLKVGNTEVVAKKIQAITGGDLFYIQTVKAYPDDYTKCTEVAQQEQTADARPQLTAKVNNMTDYDIVFLGYPNWWGTMPMAVFTFLESYNFKGKTIIPFCTNEGSAMGSSESDIRKLCPSANVLSGLPIRGSKVNQADGKISEWIKKLNIK
jgi:flavodoxin